MFRIIVSDRAVTQVLLKRFFLTPRYSVLDQQNLLDRIQASLSTEPALKGLFLSGSFGRECGDRFSDLDLVAVADAQDLRGLAMRWREILSRIVPVVFWNQRGTGTILINAVTETWQRIDLYLTGREAFLCRARDTLQPLIDPDDLFSALNRVSPTRQPDRDRVANAIREFIRVLGLLHVVDGRGEYYTAVSGAGLLRDHLLTIMVEDRAEPHGGGALRLSRRISKDDMRILNALPYPRPVRDEVVDAHLAIARVFFPRARVLASRLGIAWPEAFERATLAKLKAHFGTKYHVTWS